MAWLARPRRGRAVLAIAALVGGGALAQPITADPPHHFAAPASHDVDLSVMTYNIKGLPWPLGGDRSAALRAIGLRLASMRRDGHQPTVVLIQEAFTPEARSIGDIAGYPYQIHGPWQRAEPGEKAESGGQWYLGETGPAAVDSGLIILSDLPIEQVDRAAFPTGACAGYDCLAAKGIVMVRLDVPGHGRISIATTHFNSRAASGAPAERTHVAYRRQAEFAARFLAERRDAREPLIVGGDFNRGDRPLRIAAMTAAFRGSREGLGLAAARSADSAKILDRARDMQLMFDGTAMRLDTTGAEVPFGTEPDGSMLSDHMGFTVFYRLRAPSPAGNDAA